MEFWAAWAGQNIDGQAIISTERVLRCTDLTTSRVEMQTNLGTVTAWDANGLRISNTYCACREARELQKGGNFVRVSKLCFQQTFDFATKSNGDVLGLEVVQKEPPRMFSTHLKHASLSPLPHFCRFLGKPGPRSNAGTASSRRTLCRRSPHTPSTSSRSTARS